MKGINIYVASIVPLPPLPCHRFHTYNTMKLLGQRSSEEYLLVEDWPVVHCDDVSEHVFGY